MRRLLLLLVVLALAAFTPNVAEGRAAKPCNHGHPCPTPYVVRCGMALCLNGQTYRFTGLNIYNANSRNNCWYSLGNNDSALQDQLTASGAHVMRAWFFQRFAINEADPTIRDWSAIDHTVAVAHAAGVKLIVTLGNQWGDCEAKGGTLGYREESWYANTYKTIDPNTVAQASSYRDWVAQVVTRYRSDPNILVWQLMNEAEDAQGGVCTATAETTMLAFANDMGALVKSIDANHLLNLGSISTGQCGTSRGPDFTDLLAIPAFDIAGYHDYGHETEPIAFDVQNRWNDDLGCCGKPMMVDEAGIAASDPNRASEFSNKINATFNLGVSAYVPWEWQGAGQTGDQFSIGPGDPLLAVLVAH